MQSFPDLEASDQPVLTESSEFRFACHDCLPCFTQCCRDVNIYLTPYDVLRLRRALKMGSTEFLQKHTRHFLAKTVPIPVVQLAMDEESLACKLVTPSGCSVYGDRPWACRMFPVDLGRESGEYCFIAGKERCKGLGESKRWTVGEWMDDQGARGYMEMENHFQAIVPPGYAPAITMGPGLGKLLFLAYDLDRFVTLLNDKAFRACYEVDEEAVKRAAEDDEQMLLLAYQYIRSQLDELQ
jgi:Fe-S-cluster containining protein